MTCVHCGASAKHSSKNGCIAYLRDEIRRIRHSATAAEDRRNAAPNGSYLLADLRDVFAAHVLTGQLSDRTANSAPTGACVQDFAATAYEFADAMLVARKKKGGPDGGS